MTTITLTDPRVCQFYIDHPAISIDYINLLFIDIFEKVAPGPTIEFTTENQSLLNQMTKSVISLKDDILSMNKQQLDTIKNDCLSENNDTLMRHFQGHLAEFYDKIHKDTDALLQSNASKESIRDFIQNFELKSSIMINSLQQPICSFILASENRINQQISAIQEEHSKELSAINQKSQEHVIQEIGHLIRDSGRTPGVIIHPKQNPIMGILTKIYNSAEINVVESRIPSICTTNLKRLRKQPIYIKSIETDENVTTDDVADFIALIEDKNVCGILVSQRSGVSTKKDFQIEIYNNNILVFIHLGDYSPHKIESAVNIIDNLYTKIRQFSVNPGANECHIPKDILDSINQEYQTFMSQKNAILELLKENQKKMVTQLDEFRFPQLDKFLATRYTIPIQKPGLKCDICKSFSGNNLKALAAHKRGCVRKNPGSVLAQGPANVVSILSA